MIWWLLYTVMIWFTKDADVPWQTVSHYQRDPERSRGNVLSLVICIRGPELYDIVPLWGLPFVATKNDQHPKMIQRAFWRVVASLGPRPKWPNKNPYFEIVSLWIEWADFSFFHIFPTRLKAWLLISMAMGRKMRIFMMFHDVHGDYVSGSTGSATQELPTTSCCDPLEAASIGGWIPGRVPLVTGGYQRFGGQSHLGLVLYHDFPYETWQF